MRDRLIFGEARAFAFVFALAFTACLGKQAVAPGVEAIRYPTSQQVLASGMRVALEVAPDFGAAGLVMVVDAGAADEPSDKAGLAHLVEHLVFESRHEGMTFRHRLVSLGAGSWNGQTEWDTTSFFAFGPENELPELMSLFTNILDDPLASIDDATFEHERQVVRDEMRLQTENGTMGQSLGLLASQVFPPSHPYARTVVGTNESIDRLTLADARAFAKAHYRPSHAVLSVSSPLALDAQLAMVKKTTATREWPGSADVAGSARRSIAPIDPMANARGAIVTHELPVASPTLYIGWAIPPEGTRDADAAAVVSHMVEGTFWRHVYDHDADIASVNAGAYSGREAGMFFIEVTLKNGRDPEASANSVIRSMLRGLNELTYEDDAFEVYKRFVATDMVVAQESMISRGFDAAQSLVLTGDPTYWRLQGERTVALKSSSVADFSHRYLDDKRAHLMFAKPLIDPGAASRLSDREKGDVDGLREIEPAVAFDPQKAQSWMHAPYLRSTRRSVLDNGLEVVVVPRAGSPFHSVVVIHRGGQSDESVPGAGIASLWAKERFNMSSGAWGVQYQTRTSLDRSTEVLRSAGSNLELTLNQLTRESEYQIFWPPPQFLARIEEFEKDDLTALSVFHRRMQRALYGTHPYGRSPTSKEIHAVRPNQVYEFLDRIQRPDNGLVVVVGDVDPDAAIKLVTAKLGGRSPHGKAGPFPAPPAIEASAAGAGERLVVENRSGSTNVQMSFRCVLPKVDAGNWAAASVFAEEMDQAFVGELRERTAASYKVDAGLHLLRGGTAALEIDADLDYAHTPMVLASIRRFVDQPNPAVSDEVLLRAKGALASSFNLSLGTTDAFARWIASTWNLGWSIDSLDAYPANVLAVSASQVALLAEHCRQNWVLGLLGDESRIRASVGGWAP